MITEIRMYWRLRPYINKFKETAKMKLSVNMIVQMLGIILQAMNAMLDFVPPAKKPLYASIIGVVQAVAAVLAHFRNPDGTPAELEYVPKRSLKIGLIIGPMLFSVLCLSHGAMAQDVQGFSVGVALNQAGDSQVLGWGTYDHEIAANLFSYSGYDLLPLWKEGSKIPQLKFTPYTGLAYKIKEFGNLSLFAFGAGGMATTGEVTTGAGKYGGFGHFYLGKNWGVIAGAEGSYSPINGTDAIIRTGFRYGMKKPKS